MQDLLLSLQERFTFTALLVTHDIDEAIYLSSRCVVLSQRPATVKAVFEINLPSRHEEGDPRSDPQIRVLHAQLWELLRDDAVKAANA
jgi:NitT/TauT family transport system ATP-binding protein